MPLTFEELSTPEFDKQSLFDYIVRALHAQGKPSVERANRFTCVYRSPDGCACAAGQAIPDEAFIPELNANVPVGFAAVDAMSRGYIRGNGHNHQPLQKWADLILKRDFQRLLHSLQKAHDLGALRSPDVWWTMFIVNAKAICIHYNLSPAVFDSLPPFKAAP